MATGSPINLPGARAGCAGSPKPGLLIVDWPLIGEIAWTYLDTIQIPWTRYTEALNVRVLAEGWGGVGLQLRWPVGSMLRWYVAELSPQGEALDLGIGGWCDDSGYLACVIPNVWAVSLRCMFDPGPGLIVGDPSIQVQPSYTRAPFPPGKWRSPKHGGQNQNGVAPLAPAPPVPLVPFLGQSRTALQLIGNAGPLVVLRSATAPLASGLVLNPSLTPTGAGGYYEVEGAPTLYLSGSVAPVAWASEAD